MVKLGDYLGSLLSEVTIARVQADIQAARIAEIYSNDPLLKRFPIPRVRLPNVEISVPIVISEVEESERETFARETIKPEKLIPLAERIAIEELKEHNITLKRTEAVSFNKELKTRTNVISRIGERTVSIGSVSNAVSKEVTSIIKEVPSIKKSLPEEELKIVKERINLRIKEELIKTRVEPPRVKISPLTSQIKESGPANTSVFKLSISEDAVEWSSVEEDGETRDILIPE